MRLVRAYREGEVFCKTGVPSCAAIESAHLCFWHRRNVPRRFDAENKASGYSVKENALSDKEHSKIAFEKGKSLLVLCQQAELSRSLTVQANLVSPFFLQMGEVPIKTAYGRKQALWGSVILPQRWPAENAKAVSSLNLGSAPKASRRDNGHK